MRSLTQQSVVAAAGSIILPLFMLGCGVNATQPADDGGGAVAAAPNIAHDKGLADREDDEIIASGRKALSLKDRPSRAWEQLLVWLPEDTETVIVAQGPFEIKRRESERFSFQEAALLLPTGPLLTLGRGMVRRELRGQKILCAVEGSRQFRSPRGLGMMPYEGCHIIQFEAASEESLGKAFQKCQAKAEEKINVAGQQVAVLTEKFEDDTWHSFVCHPRPGVLICATDREYLEATVKRIGQTPGRRALPGELPEWKHVDVKARVWAVRHYDKVSAEKDPSSPLRAKAAANVPDAAAVGFVFWYCPDSDQVAHACYLSGAKDALKLAELSWNLPSEGLRPTIKQAAPGVVKIATSVSKKRIGEVFLLVLLAHLGHAVYL